MATLSNTKSKQLYFISFNKSNARMARCLSEALIKYQTAEEAKILSIADELDEPSKSLVRELYEPLVSTKISGSIHSSQNCLPFV